MIIQIVYNTEKLHGNGALELDVCGIQNQNKRKIYV